MLRKKPSFPLWVANFSFTHTDAQIGHKFPSPRGNEEKPKKHQRRMREKRWADEIKNFFSAFFARFLLLSMSVRPSGLQTGMTWEQRRNASSFSPGSEIAREKEEEEKYCEWDFRTRCEKICLRAIISPLQFVLSVESGQSSLSFELAIKKIVLQLCLS